MVFSYYSGFGQELTPTQAEARRALERAVEYGCRRGNIRFMQMYAKAVELGAVPAGLSAREVCGLFGYNLALSREAEARRTEIYSAALKACIAGDRNTVADLLRTGQAEGLINAAVTDLCAILAGQREQQPSGFERRELTPAELEMIRQQQQQKLLERLPAISVEDLQGVIAAVNAGQGYKDSRYDQLAPFLDIFVAELRRRDLAVRDVAFVEEQPVADVASPSVDQPQMVETVASAVEVAAGAPAKSNTGLYVGLGLAAVAAYFVFGRK